MRAQGGTIGRRVAVTILLIGSVLLGLLALHSMGGPGGSGLMAAMPAASIHSVSTAPNHTSPAGDPVAMTASAVVVASAVSVVSTMSAGMSSSGMSALLDTASCTDGGPLDCVAAAMACVILFLLASVVFIAGGPAALRWLMHRAPRLAGLAPRALPFFSAPSLVELSISRT